MMQLQEINKRTTDRVKRLFDKKAVRFTQIVLIIVTAILVVLDIWLYIKPPEGNTISAVIRDNAVGSNLFVITWIWGILTGHLFIARKKKDQNQSNTLPQVIAISTILLVSIIIFLLGRFIPVPEPRPDGLESTIPIWMHIILLAFGTLCGYFLWPQELKSN